MTREIKYLAEAQELAKFQWLRCERMAHSLATHGVDAIPALEVALKSRVHHVRSASLLAIEQISPERAVDVSKMLVNDRAYEVRQTAQTLLDKYA